MGRNPLPNPQRTGTSHNVSDAAFYGAFIAFNKTPATRPSTSSTPGNKGDVTILTNATGNASGPPAIPHKSAESRATVKTVATTKPTYATSRKSFQSSIADSEGFRAGGLVNRTTTASTPAFARLTQINQGQMASPSSNSKGIARSNTTANRFQDMAEIGSSGSIMTGTTGVDSQPPTKSLISKYEQGVAKSQLPGRNISSSINSPITKETEKSQSVAGRGPPLVAPKPQRMVSTKSVLSAPQTSMDTSMSRQPTIARGIVASPVQSPDATGARILSVAATKPALPPPRRHANTQPVPYDPPKATSPRTTQSHPRTLSLDEPPVLTPPRAILRDLSPPGSAPPLSRSPNPHSHKQKSLMRSAQHLSPNTLANAMVGANLASKSVPHSRQPSPHGRDPLPIQRSGPYRMPSPRRRAIHHINQHFRSSRSASPPKRLPGQGMLHSLRDVPCEDSDSSGERGRLDKLTRKHPHKHHEGTRKRWRDVIDDGERKRYEGVWAVNRGLWVPRAGVSGTAQEDAENDVLDLVVKDIWGRSGLAPHVLAEIWELVDRRQIRRLSREEFVVGLWLVDQRLKGRKLPSKVADSVWGSVTGLGTRGVKVRLK